MKNKRSHGTDFIDPYSLKLAGPLIEGALLHIVNLSIQQNKFSTNWKTQLVNPLHKKGDKLQVDNYRPVSHLIEVGKIVEHAVYEQVVNHFTAHSLFHPNHHGSISDHSTTTALTQLVDMWIDAAESKELSAVLLLDQSAAYDLIDHSTLSEKMKIYNFEDKTIQWFKSYMENRTQIVQIESKQNSPIQLEDYRVPKGSVLGGLLFIIFSNDFPDSCIEGNSVVYVDDDTDVTRDKHFSVLEEKMQREANRSTAWLSDNGMKVAGDKSKLLVIGTQELRRARTENRLMEITVDNKKVMETENERLLGLTINNRLTWREHFYGVRGRDDNNNQIGLISELNQRVGMIKKLAKHVPTKKLKNYANAIYDSKLLYCLPVFGNVFGLDTYRDNNHVSRAYTREDNRKIQVTQNKLMRILSRSERNTATTELLQKTNSLSVQQMIAFQTIVATKRVIDKKKPKYLAERLQTTENNQRNILTNQNCNTILPVNRNLSVSRDGFTYQAYKLFNKLPANVRSERKLTKFKKLTRDWIKKNIDPKRGITK